MSDELLLGSIATGGLSIGALAQRFYDKWREDRAKERAEEALQAQIVGLTEAFTKQLAESNRNTERVVSEIVHRVEAQEEGSSKLLSSVATKLEAVSIKLAEVAERLAGASATASGLEQRINKGLENHSKRLHDLEMGMARAEGRQEALEGLAAQGSE